MHGIIFRGHAQRRLMIFICSGINRNIGDYHMRNCDPSIKAQGGSLQSNQWHFVCKLHIFNHMVSYFTFLCKLYKFSHMYYVYHIHTDIEDNRCSTLVYRIRVVKLLKIVYILYQVMHELFNWSFIYIFVSILNV